MKRIRFLISVLLIFSATGFGQQINVPETVAITAGNRDFTSPQFSPDGSKILFTQSGFRGLWLYDLSDKSSTQLNDHIGAGYEPVFTKDSRRIIFRVDEYIKMRKYSALAIQTIGGKKIEYLSEKMRYLSPALGLSDNRVAAIADKEARTFSIDKKESALAASIQEPITYIEDQKIALVKDGKKAILAPFGEGNYIRPSLSPDKTGLLFTFVGRGTFISDLSGNINAELGIARSPKWSPDGKWVVYMLDEDDGHVITASDIWVVTADVKTRIQLTKTNEIKEMYPDWSTLMDKIAFNTVDGKIGYLTIEISE